MRFYTKILLHEGFAVCIEPNNGCKPPTDQTANLMSRPGIYSNAVVFNLIGSVGVDEDDGGGRAGGKYCLSERDRGFGRKREVDLIGGLRFSGGHVAALKRWRQRWGQVILGQIFRPVLGCLLGIGPNKLESDSWRTK